MRTWALLVAVVMAASVTAPWGGSAGSAAPTGPDDWLGRLNELRAEAGVGPVSADPSLAPSLEAHLTYLAETPGELRQGVYADPHRENPQSPFFTPEGNRAGSSSNLIWGPTTPVAAIDGWFRSPVHLAWLLQPNLSRTWFVQRGSTSIIDVHRGIAPGPPHPTPVLFPGPGSTSTFTEAASGLRSLTERCGPMPQRFGPPIVLLLPGPPGPGGSASLRRSDGATASSTDGGVCVLDEYNVTAGDPALEQVARNVMGDLHVVVLVPDRPLPDGDHWVTYDPPTGAAISWPFSTTGGDPALSGDPGGSGEVRADQAGERGYWVLEDDGTSHGFGAAATWTYPNPLQAVSLDATPDGTFAWVLEADGVVNPLVGGRDLGSLPTGRLHSGERVTSLSATPDGGGYWIFTDRGRVFRFGTAGFFGDMTGVVLDGPVVASVATPSGRGYYMVAADGGVFAFGDARFAGSMGGRPLDQPVVSLVPDPDGRGYWLIAADGGVFAFGAPFVGSVAGLPLDAPVIDAVAAGSGYTLVAADGGVFDFSGGEFLGSLGGRGTARRYVDLAAFVRPG